MNAFAVPSRRPGTKFICYIPDLPLEFEIKLMILDEKVVAVAVRKGALTPAKVFKGGKWVEL